jgi:glycine cleavage system H protein
MPMQGARRSSEMPTVRGCSLPDDLLYDVANHMWFQEQADGSVKLGMTTYGTAMAGPLMVFTPKEVGRKVDAGKSCATIESGKWVGPATSAVGGIVIAVNGRLVGNPSLANEDPYGAGWMVLLRPDDWVADRANLTPGAQVAPEYEAKMDAVGYSGRASRAT